MNDFFISLLGDSIYYLVSIFTAITGFIPLVIKPGKIFNRSFNGIKRLRWGGVMIVSSSLLGIYFNDLQNQNNDRKNDAKTKNIEQGVKKNSSIVETTNSNVVYLKNKIQDQSDLINLLKSNNSTLINQNKYMMKSSKDLFNSNRDLHTQNENMLNKVDKYQNIIELREKEIERLKEETYNIKQYTYYALRNHIGLEAYYDENQFDGFHTDLSKKMKKFFKHNVSNKYPIAIVGDLSLLVDAEKVIKDYPYFPFVYWPKCILEKYNGDPRWKETAIKGIAIFEITTKIEGHNKEHESVLRILKNELQNNGASFSK